MNREWIQPWAEALSASEPFTIALDDALAADAARRAGIDVRQSFALLPSDDASGIAHQPDGSARGEAVLVAVNFGYDVAIGWRCTQHDGERLEPSDPMPPERGCRLSAWWIDLPADELRAKYSGPVAQPFPLGARSFPVELWALVWPDLWFEVEVPTSHPDEGARLRSAFGDATAAWNDAHPQASIGPASDPRLVGPDAWEIYLSFGADGPPALDAVLASVDQALPGIKRVVVRGFPARR